MEAVGYIIVGAPGQYAIDSIEDLLFLAGHRVLAGVSVYYPAPASADYETCRDLGILPQSFSLMRSSTLPISHTTTRLETVTLMRLGRIINFMKHLADQGLNIPSPEGFDGSARIDPQDRETAGIFLLSGFLRDGLIRGLTPEGAVYQHAVSGPLIERFSNRFRTVPVRGVKGAGVFSIFPR
jgi:hypothetical protein